VTLPIILALLTAVLFGLNAIPAKKLTEETYGDIELTWIHYGIGTVALWIYAFSFGTFRLTSDFSLYLVLGLAGNAAAITFYFRAVRNTELSIAMPLFSLSPLYIIVTSYLMLGETINFGGAAGIMLIVIGAYFLGCSKGNISSWTAPVRALLQDRGARYALLASFTWAFTSNIDKLALRESDPAYYPAIFSLSMAVIYAPLVTKKKRWGRVIPHSPRLMFLVILFGLTSAAMIACQMAAIAELPVAYVIAIKRAGLLIGVVVAAMSGESGIIWKLSGALIILAGVIAIILS